MSLGLWNERLRRWQHSRRSSKPYVVKLGGTINVGTRATGPGTVGECWRLLCRLLWRRLGGR